MDKNPCKKTDVIFHPKMITLSLFAHLFITNLNVGNSLKGSYNAKLI